MWSGNYKRVRISKEIRKCQIKINRETRWREREGEKGTTSRMFESDKDGERENGELEKERDTE